MKLESKTELSNAQRLLERKRKEAARRRGWGNLALKMFCTALTMYLVFGVFIGISSVRGNSMEPTMENGDVVLFSRLGEKKKGDLVILHKEKSVHLIKRIVATAGDTVDIDNKSGELLINGVRTQEDYIYVQTYQMKNGIEFPLVLKENEVFVLGDNRAISLDSRELGPIDINLIDGKVILTFRLLK